MKRALNLVLGLAVCGPLFLATESSSKAYAQTTVEIVSRTAEPVSSSKVAFDPPSHE
jgi:hypothetical protein